MSRGTVRIVLIGGAGLLAVAAGGVWAFTGLSDSCSGSPVNVKVVAQPGMVPALRAAAGRFNVETREVRGRCVRVAVAPVEPAAAVRGLVRGDLNADGWVPESSLWLARARSAGAKAVPAMSPSIAATPVLFAVARPVAGELDPRPSWKLLKSAEGGLAPRMLSPAVSATGTVTMIAMKQVGKPGKDFVRDMRRAAPKDPGALFGQLTGISRADRALLVTTEQAVVAYNETHRANPATRLPPREGTLLLDHPFAVTASDPARRAGAEAFQAALGSRSARENLQRYGFRAPDGTMAAAQARRHGLPGAAPRPLKLPDQKEIDRAQRSWNAR